MKGRPEKAEYALYKGDTFICMGTIKEIAKKMGVTKKTVYWWGSPAARRREGKNKFKKTPNRKLLIKIEGEEK